MSVDQTLDHEEDEIYEDDDERGLSASKGRATPGKRNRSSKVATSGEGGNFITRPLRGLFTFISEVRDELNKVTWPTREETRRLSIIVTAATIVTSIALGIISLIFTELFRIGLSTPAVLLAVLVIAVVVLVVAWRGSNRDNRSF